MTREQRLNLKADALEGKIYNHFNCEYAVKSFEEEGFMCGQSDCIHKKNYEEILKQITKRTEAL